MAAYSRTFYAETPEEALRLAREYLQTIDPYEQPKISAYGVNWEGKGYAVVMAYGLD